MAEAMQAHVLDMLRSTGDPDAYFTKAFEASPKGGPQGDPRSDGKGELLDVESWR